MRIDSIVVGERVRKDLGDIATLSKSMEKHGLLHPIVINKPDRLLIAGYRRLKAAVMLGWKEIPANEIEITDLLSAERDENEVRKNLTRTEAIEIGRLIEKTEKINAEERRRLGRWAEKNASGKNPEASSNTKGNVRDIVGKAIGMDGRTYEKGKSVIEAAENKPGKFGDLPAEMDSSCNINGTYKEMKRRQIGGSGRHPVHAKTHHMKAEPAITKALNMLDGVLIALDSIDARMLAEIEEEKRADYARQFVFFARKISKFGRRVAK
jgi:ParB family chromosome partitioning protein